MFGSAACLCSRALRGSLSRAPYLAWAAGLEQELWARLYPLADALYGEHWSNVGVDWNGLREVPPSLLLNRACVWRLV